MGTVTWQIRHFKNVTEFNALPVTDFSVFELDHMERVGFNLVKEKFKNKKLICYISASYEDWRIDAKNYPASGKGKKMDGWNELWGNITDPALQDFLELRFKRCADVGAQYVEIDNTDVSQNDVGFSVTDNQNAQALLELSVRAKKHGLGIFLKNTGYLASKLEASFSGVMNEECHQWKECDDFSPFVSKGKPVFQVEYGNTYCKPYLGHSVQLKSDYFGATSKYCK